MLVIPVISSLRQLGRAFKPRDRSHGIVGHSISTDGWSDVEQNENTGEERKDCSERIGDDTNMSEEQQREITRQVDAYEEELRKTYRRKDDSRIIKRKKRTFFQDLVQKADDEEQLNIDDLRQEEHDLISTNLWLSLSFIILFVVGAVFVSDRIESIAMKVTKFITHYFSWFYILICTGSLIFLIYLAFSRFGAVVLGEPDEEPEFSDFSWASMLFSAGMGVGLLFWGGAEPVCHYINPPLGAGRTVAAARDAMVFASFHWGLHAWAVYVLTAIGVAYYGFRKRKKYLMSSAILDITDRPRVFKALKVFTDFVSTLAVVFGVAAAIGMGVMKIAGGFKYAYGLDVNNTSGYIVILLSITIFFIASATTGLKKGIKWLSNLNMSVAMILMLFVFIVGPTLFICKVFVDTIGLYLNELPRLSFKIAPFIPAYEAWMGRWTLTWLTWWIAWAPFVGIFIARISRGRTIREVIVGSLIFPTIFTIAWFSIFGGAALHLEMFGDGGIGSLATNSKTVTQSLFALLDFYPLKGLTASVSILLLFTFLVTSADSACFAIAMMTTEGDLDPGTGMKVLWGVVLSVLTLILVLGGGIKATSAAALIFAFPFSIVMILIAISLTIRLSLQVARRRI